MAAASYGSVLIAGLGKSGLASCLYLLARPERFTALAVADTAEQPARSAELADAAAAAGIPVTTYYGIDEVPSELHFDTGIVSPGLRPMQPFYVSLRATCTALLSELEFAWCERPATWVALTGTNGKTTTTALTTHLLQEAGFDAHAVGNIGTPAIGMVDACADHEAPVFVAECSSFQLHETHRFHPQVAAVLNVTPDHIDWHGSFDAYRADKAHIFARCGAGDTVLLNGDDEATVVLQPEAEATGAAVTMIRRADGRLATWCAPEELHIKGPHNESNALFAACAARALGADDAAIARGLRSFLPVEHRLQLIATLDGVQWYNDSKATNPDAVFKALSAFSEQPVYLLVGGRNKGNRFLDLATYAFGRGNVARVICFGETGGLLHDDFSTVEQALPTYDAASPLTVQVPTMEAAVERARVEARTGAVVLLSPACASFDEFNSFEHRGEEFVRMVKHGA